MGFEQNFHHAIAVIHGAFPGAHLKRVHRLLFRIVPSGGESLVRIAPVIGDTNGSVWVGVAAPPCAALIFAIIFVAQPPSRAEGTYEAPLLAPLREKRGAGDEVDEVAAAKVV